MVEYIDREALIQELDAKLCSLHGELDENRIVYDAFNDGFEECVGEVGKFQFAEDVAPVGHGHWETNSDRPDTLICPVCKCGFDMWKHDPHNFCPNCGANLDIQDRGDNDEKSM